MKKLTCIVCPNSCSITAEGKEIKGYKCKRGLEFALDELTHPMRVVTGTVRTSFPNMPVLPVKTREPIPREQVFTLMREMKKVCLDKQVNCGDVVIHNALALGVDVVATDDLKEMDN